MHKPALVAFALLAFLALGPSLPRAQDAPVPVDYFELEDHRVAGATSFRSADAPDGNSGMVILNIVIDEGGNVVAVAPSRDSSRREIRRWYGRAQALARQWRFRPFVRNGRAVRAQARGQVEVLPPERLPRRRRPFPDVPLEDVSITLMRGGCFGSCPVYTVTIHGNGRVRFEPLAYTAVDQVQETSIPVERVERLVARFREARFWSLDDEYSANISDSPGYRLTVRAGSRTKSVFDYVGTEVGMPDVVRELQDAVDEAAGTARWVRGEQAAPE